MLHQNRPENGVIPTVLWLFYARIPNSEKCGRSNTPRTRYLKDGSEKPDPRYELLLDAEDIILDIKYEDARISNESLLS